MMGRKLQEEWGQSLVESALVLPVLILILMAVIEMGWMIYNRISFDNMAQVAVHANSKTDDLAATEYVEKYVRRNFSRYDDSSLRVKVAVEQKTYEYSEYVYKVNQHKYWEVPMYFDIMRSSMEISYDVPYLTGFGKMLFQDTDNHLTLTANAMATRALENESIKWRDEQDGGEDSD
ncbi:MAG: pilus assembly protein [Clostridium sp.]|nr:pilus assembly protein [Clostridium sp.]